MKNNKFKVQYGSIYDDRGIGIDNMSVIYGEAVIPKYGDTDKDNMEAYYETLVSKYRSIGFNEMADSISLIKFDRYDGILDIEEICTLCNYIFMVSANYDIINKLLTLNSDELKNELTRLKELGF